MLQCLPDTVQVAVGVTRAVVVDDDVHALDIDTTPEDIGRDKNAFLECLESGVTGDTR